MSLATKRNNHGRIDKRRAAVKPLHPVDAARFSAHSAIKVQRERVEKTTPENVHEHTRCFLSSLPADQGMRLGQAVRGHWSLENKNHHKRDPHVWQEDRHRHPRANIALNLALTRNALWAIIPFDEQNIFRRWWRNIAITSSEPSTWPPKPAPSHDPSSQTPY